MNYSEKLKDPRWQRKRLEVMQRDGFACICCSDKSNTLHVHHCYYVSGREPWEYPTDTLLTLCKKCHASVGEEGTEARSLATFWESSVGFEIQRALSNRSSDEGALWAIAECVVCKDKERYPLPEALNTLAEAGDVGLLTFEFFSWLRDRVIEKRAQVASERAAKLKSACA